MKRYSYWAQQLDRARKANGWFAVDRTYTEKTARQIASDIRGGRRVNGIQPNETWEVEVHAPTDRDQTFDWSIQLKRVNP